MQDLLQEGVSMATEPQTWHYGLVAQWWAEFNIGGPDIDYYQKAIERYGQPALDVACGTGRLLLPYLRAGLDVDGCDISPDMLALCRDKAQREGLAPRLYEAAMHELDLPRHYKTIYICDSFGIGGSREMDQKALQRIHHHLEPGGVLVFSQDAPYGDPGWWPYWLKENRSQLPLAWEPPESGKPENLRRASDGAEYELRSRVLDIDPLEQTYTFQIEASRWQDGQQIAQEERILRGCIYFKNELLMMLERAGFRDVAVYGGYTDLAATSEDTKLVFVAIKHALSPLRSA
jgi:SAM-dependent methyltransferase